MTNRSCETRFSSPDSSSYETVVTHLPSEKYFLLDRENSNNLSLGNETNWGSPNSNFTKEYITSSNINNTISPKEFTLKSIWQNIFGFTTKGIQNILPSKSIRKAEKFESKLKNMSKISYQNKEDILRYQAVDTLWNSRTSPGEGYLQIKNALRKSLLNSEPTMDDFHSQVSISAIKNLAYRNHRPIKVTKEKSKYSLYSVIDEKKQNSESMSKKVTKNHNYLDDRDSSNNRKLVRTRKRIHSENDIHMRRATKDDMPEPTTNLNETYISMDNFSSGPIDNKKSKWIQESDNSSTGNCEDSECSLVIIRAASPTKAKSITPRRRPTFTPPSRLLSSKQTQINGFSSRRAVNSPPHTQTPKVNRILSGYREYCSSKPNDIIYTPESPQLNTKSINNYEYRGKSRIESFDNNTSRQFSAEISLQPVDITPEVSISPQSRCSSEIVLEGFSIESSTNTSKYSDSYTDRSNSKTSENQNSPISGSYSRTIDLTNTFIQQEQTKFDISENTNQPYTKNCNIADTYKYSNESNNKESQIDVSNYEKQVDFNSQLFSHINRDNSKNNEKSLSNMYDFSLPDSSYSYMGYPSTNQKPNHINKHIKKSLTHNENCIKISEENPTVNQMNEQSSTGSPITIFQNSVIPSVFESLKEITDKQNKAIYNKEKGIKFDKLCHPIMSNNTLVYNPPLKVEASNNIISSGVNFKDRPKFRSPVFKSFDENKLKTYSPHIILSDKSIAIEYTPQRIILNSELSQANIEKSNLAKEFKSHELNLNSNSDNGLETKIRKKIDEHYDNKREDILCDLDLSKTNINTQSKYQGMNINSNIIEEESIVSGPIDAISDISGYSTYTRQDNSENVEYVQLPYIAEDQVSILDNSINSALNNESQGGINVVDNNISDETDQSIPSSLNNNQSHNSEEDQSKNKLSNTETVNASQNIVKYNLQSNKENLFKDILINSLVNTENFNSKPLYDKNKNQSLRESENPLPINYLGENTENKSIDNDNQLSLNLDEKNLHDQTIINHFNTIEKLNYNSIKNITKMSESTDYINKDNVGNSNNPSCSKMVPEIYNSDTQIHLNYTNNIRNSAEYHQHTPDEINNPIISTPINKNSNIASNDNSVLDYKYHENTNIYDYNHSNEISNMFTNTDEWKNQPLSIESNQQKINENHIITTNPHLSNIISSNSNVQNSKLINPSFIYYPEESFEQKNNQNDLIQYSNNYISSNNSPNILNFSNINSHKDFTPNDINYTNSSQILNLDNTYEKPNDIELNQHISIDNIMKEYTENNITINSVLQDSSTLNNNLNINYTRYNNLDLSQQKNISPDSSTQQYSQNIDHQISLDSNNQLTRLKDHDGFYTESESKEPRKICYGTPPRNNIQSFDSKHGHYFSRSSSRKNHTLIQNTYPILNNDQECTEENTETPWNNNETHFISSSPRANSTYSYNNFENIRDYSMLYPNNTLYSTNTYPSNYDLYHNLQLPNNPTGLVYDDSRISPHIPIQEQFFYDKLRPSTSKCLESPHTQQSELYMNRSNETYLQYSQLAPNSTNLIHPNVVYNPQYTVPLKELNGYTGMMNRHINQIDNLPYSYQDQFNHSFRTYNDNNVYSNGESHKIVSNDHLSNSSDRKGRREGRYRKPNHCSEGGRRHRRHSSSTGRRRHRRRRRQDDHEHSNQYEVEKARSISPLQSSKLPKAYPQSTCTSIEVHSEISGPVRGITSKPGVTDRNQ